jgi:hypothetical protein
LLQRHKEGKINLINETIIDDECVYVQYIEKDSDNTSLINTNVALAGFITSQARLRLYAQIELIGKERVIYCDTDSIVYVNDPNGYNIPSGDMLGEWEDETATKEHKSNPIIEFIALAPKSYGYKTQFGEGDIKCKGITLNYNNANEYTHDTLNKLVIGEIDTINTDKLVFIKDTKKGEIRTINQSKVLKFDRTKTKSIIQKDYSTEPYRQTTELEIMLDKRILAC